MCFEMTYHVDYVEEPDVKTNFEVLDAGDPNSSMPLMEAQVKVAAKIWMANQIVAKAIEVATAHGRIQEVKIPSDIPEMWERGILFVGTSLAQQLVDVAHREVMWVDHHIQLRDKVIMLQLKDFSFAAMVSFGEVRDDQEPMREGVLIRRECRIKFGLEAEQAMIYQLPEDWLEVAIEKARRIDVV
jgi:hypothetical protein